jgi:hypothetical protein
MAKMSCICLDKMHVLLAILTTYLPDQDIICVPFTQVPPGVTDVVQCSIQQWAEPKYYNACHVPLHSFDSVLPYR